MGWYASWYGASYICTSGSRRVTKSGRIVLCVTLKKSSRDTGISVTSRFKMKEASHFNAQLPPLRVCQNYGRVNLAFGNGPIPFKEPVFFLGANYSKAVPLIELDRPLRCGPRADQYRPDCQLSQMGQ